jgi:hypothetical protein
MKKAGRKRGTKIGHLRDQKNKIKNAPMPDALSNEKHTAAHQYLVDRIFQYIIEGRQKSDVFLLLQQEDPTIDLKRFNKLEKEAISHVEMTIHKDREYVFALHLDRYERIYWESMKLENRAGFKLDPYKDLSQIAMSYKDAIISLRSKEELIGLHNPKMILELDQDKAYAVDDRLATGRLPGLDLEKLSLEELIELLAIVKESRTVEENGVQRVVVKQRTVIEIDGQLRVENITHNIDNVLPIEDIGFEEMPEDVVSKMIDSTPPEPVPEPVKELIQDLVPKVEKKEARDVLQKIHENHIEELKRKMKGL